MKALQLAFEAAKFLRNARMGGIIPPDQLRAELRAVKELPAIAGYAIAASVPNWLVEKLDPNRPMASHYQLFPTLDRRDALLLANLQPRRPPKLPHLWPLKLLHLAGVN